MVHEGILEPKDIALDATAPKTHITRDRDEEELSFDHPK